MRFPLGASPSDSWNLSHAARSRAVAFTDPDGFGSFISYVGIRSTVRKGARILRSVLLGADAYEEDEVHDVGLGIGRDVVLDGVIVDKNARIADGVRLVNDSGVEEADGDGYYIRSGVIVVPKGAVVTKGM